MPRFIDPPQNKTVKCEELTEEDTNPEPELEYDNNVSDPPECEISGTITPDITSNFGPCGGDIIKIWTWADEGCEYSTYERRLEHVQRITVTYSEKAEWIDPPADTTMSCVAGQQYVQNGPTELSYENHPEGGDLDACRVHGTATGYICAVVGPCEGQITQTWTADDDCRRILNHTQVVTTEQAPAPNWVNPPQNTTLNCLAAWMRLQLPITQFKLEYSNQLTGGCKIQGFVEPVIAVNVTECAGTITYTWEMEDQCGRPLNHTQTITVTPQ